MEMKEIRKRLKERLARFRACGKSTRGRGFLNRPQIHPPESKKEP